MQTKTDVSYGVVPIIKDGASWKVLLVHQISHRGGKNTFWILPKGHAEAGESPVEAAQRELAEETGVTDVKIQSDSSFDVSYSFVHEGVMINKTVQYFVGECRSQDTKLTQPEEILEIKWFPLKEAKEKVSHKNTREILEQVEDQVLQG
jgi:8-oxo-dGTP pyrophosphatase MutT (NUDIX family)